MTSEKIRDLTKIGICIKSTDTIVEYQNPMCENICGHQIGHKCAKGCITKLKTESGEILNAGYKLYRNTQVDNNNVDTIITNDGEKITTLLFKKEEDIQKQLNTLAKYNLSKSEIGVMKKFLEGYSNFEIAEHLFISKSTLRTHLNNIYKKIPSELKEEIISRHFGNESKKKQAA